MIDSECSDCKNHECETCSDTYFKKSSVIYVLNVVQQLLIVINVMIGKDVHHVIMDILLHGIVIGM